MAGTTHRQHGAIWWQRLAFMGLSTLAGMALGLVLARSGLLEALGAMGGAQRLLGFCLLLATVVVTFALGIVLHEAGHLVCGLLSGYDFVSYRVGSLMWVREDGRLAFKRFSLAGTGGQCLMSPPGEQPSDAFPTTLYNLGGVLANLLSAAAMGLLWALLRGRGAAAVTLATAALVSLLMAATNGVPLRLDVPNDGYNALTLRRSAAARRAFWIELKVNALQQQGMRLQELPDDWFAFPDAEGLHNALVATVGVFAIDRLMDQQRFDEAERLIPRLLADDCAAAGIYRQLLVCEQTYCALLRQGDAADVSHLHERPLASFFKQMRSFPTVLRLWYAVALLKEHDEAKAAGVRDEFERMAERYPAPAAIATERALMDAARAAAQRG